MTTPSQLAEQLDFLAARVNYERAGMPYAAGTLKLDRMHALLDALGSPQSRFPIVHVAGTKGKGSTSAMIAAMLQASGFRTALYTSPHLYSLAERMRVNGAACTEAQLCAALARVRPAVERLDREAQATGVGLTWFDITTAAALVHFAEQSVHAAVLEVGLGGRLDSTNACRPVVSVITSISFDHMAQLGNTLAEIAGEKAGIIKPGIPCVTGVTLPEPRGVIERAAANAGAPLFIIDRDFHASYAPPSVVAAGETRMQERPLCGALAYRENAFELKHAPLGLAGRHQARNAAVAVASLRRLIERGWHIPPAAMQHGLSAVKWPARVEVVRNSPLTIVDAAHNVASVDALLQTLDETTRAQRRVLLFAASRDKEVLGMLRRLQGACQEIVFTKFVRNPRALEPQELCRMWNALAQENPDKPIPPAHMCDTPQLAWKRVLDIAQAHDLVAVTGSMFIAAEIRELAMQ